jgi:thioredoxin-related protein
MKHFKIFLWSFLVTFFLTKSVFAEKLNLKLLMIDDTACPYCELWEEEIGYMYIKTEEGKLAPLIRHHYGEKIPEDITLISDPIVTPTFILLKENKEKYRIEGYPGEEFFWSFLSEYIQRIKKMENN